VRSYYCICTSCASFVNAFRHCRVITAHCIRSCAFLLSHAIRLWLPPAPNPVEPLRASLCILSWLGNDKSCSSSSGCCGCSRIQNKSIVYAAAHKFTMAVPTRRSPEVNLKCDLTSKRKIELFPLTHPIIIIF